MSAEVSLVTKPPKRTMESFFTALSKRSYQHIENETAERMKGKLGRGGERADKNGIQPPTFYFAPPPLMS